MMLQRFIAAEVAFQGLRRASSGAALARNAAAEGSAAIASSSSSSSSTLSRILPQQHRAATISFSVVGTEAAGYLRSRSMRFQTAGLFSAGARPFLPFARHASTAAAAAARQRQPEGIVATVRRLVADYKQLSKFRLSLLVVSTAAGGYVLGSGEEVDWAGLGWTSLGTLGAAACANTLNQIYEVKMDSLMKRTMNRPLPSARVSRVHALAFAIATGAGGVLLLADKTNNLTAALGMGNILLYAGLYTPLKTVSIVNTWVGAVVGAVPPLMGWAAASGTLTPGAAALAAVLYWWQMPHFMALAWMCRVDYAAGGYRMLSLVDATGRRTAACAMRNCVYLMPLGIIAVCLGVTTDAFAFENALISGGMAATAGAFYQAPSTASARVLFRASLVHLPLLMACMMAHRIPNHSWSVSDLAHRLRQRFVVKEEAVAVPGSSPPLPFPAPFPFLPVPMLVDSPDSSECEAPSDARQPARPAR
mmetsp:Transcript_9635/g.27570  ORF Transcript_9635/g.27570 Transcript_9635/m.27570 type:complete len:477 (-) Transcript_9635:10-1440(-)